VIGTLNTTILVRGWMVKLCTAVRRGSDLRFCAVLLSKNTAMILQSTKVLGNNNQ